MKLSSVLFVAATCIVSLSRSPVAISAEPREFRITAIVSSTGPAAALGSPERRAVELFEKEAIPKLKLPFKVSVTTYDDASDPTKSVTLVRKAVEEDHADIVICCTTTPTSMAILETVKSSMIPMISMASSIQIVEPASARPFSFSTSTSDRLMLIRTLAYMKRQGIKKIAFFGLDDSYGEAGLRELAPIAKKEGVEVIATERFARQDTSFTPQALRIRQTQADAVYIHAIPPSANLAHEAIKRVGFNGPIYHGDGSSLTSFVEIGKSAVEGAIVGVGALNIYDQISKDNAMRQGLQEFAQVFDASYGVGKVDEFAGQAWDAMMIAIKAYQSVIDSGKPTPDVAAVRLMMRDSLEKTKLVGVVGVYNVTPEDHLGLDHRSTFLAQIKNGKFVLLEE